MFWVAAGFVPARLLDVGVFGDVLLVPELPCNAVNHLTFAFSLFVADSDDSEAVFVLLTPPYPAVFVAGGHRFVAEIFSLNGVRSGESAFQLLLSCSTM